MARRRRSRHDAPLERFRAHLKSERLSWTAPRALIAELALQTRGHFTVQDLVERVHRREPTVGRVTVYRTLALLVASGLVAERDFQRDRMHYEVITDRPHHEHMICLGCDRIIEFINDEIERLQQVVAAKHDFVIVDHIHKLFGYCASCQGKLAHKP